MSLQFIEQLMLHNNLHNYKRLNSGGIAKSCHWYIAPTKLSVLGFSSFHNLLLFLIKTGRNLMNNLMQTTEEFHTNVFKQEGINLNFSKV